MNDIAPDIFRQRLLVEGYYAIPVTQEVVERFLLELPKYLNLRTYGEPVVFAPGEGMGKEENQGYDGFIPLIDSGISIYVWATSRFFSTVLYTCKGFDEEVAVEFIRTYWKVSSELVIKSF